MLTCSKQSSPLTPPDTLELVLFPLTANQLSHKAAAMSDFFLAAQYQALFATSILYYTSSLCFLVATYYAISYETKQIWLIGLAFYGYQCKFVMNTAQRIHSMIQTHIALHLGPRQDCLDHYISKERSSALEKPKSTKRVRFNISP